MKISVAILIGLALAGCQTAKPERIVETVTVEVPSSKPYRYITYDDQTPAKVAKQIRRHNRTHALVIEAEKAKAAQ